MSDPAAGDASRNRTVGLRIGKGEKLEDIIKSTNTVAEGVLTSRYCVSNAQNGLTAGLLPMHPPSLSSPSTYAQNNPLRCSSPDCCGSLR